MAHPVKPDPKPSPAHQPKPTTPPSKPTMPPGKPSPAYTPKPNRPSRKITLFGCAVWERGDTSDEKAAAFLFTPWDHIPKDQDPHSMIQTQTGFDLTVSVPADAEVTEDRMHLACTIKNHRHELTANEVRDFALHKMHGFSVA